MIASVVVTNYNYERFLQEAIDSALAQTYRAVEVVVVDDGSTDASRQVIARYGDRIIPVLKANGGMGSALNAGFAASRGDIVLFLDSDDKLLPGAVETAVPHFGDHDVAKVQWALWEIGARGRRTGRVVPKWPLPEGDLRDAVVREGPLAAGSPPTSANAWSRHFLDRVLPMPERDLRQHADSYLNTLASLFGRLCKVEEPQGCYRVHGDNDYASRAKSEQLRRNLEMYHYRCRLLYNQLRAEGVEVHPDAWKTGNAYYERLRGKFAAAEDIAAIVPAGATFIFVDEGAWGGGVAVAGRRSIPFPERDGRFGGRPADGAAAVAELERLRAQGATFIAFVRPALWWLDHYGELDGHLRSRYSRELANDWCVVFNLQG